MHSKRERVNKQKLEVVNVCCTKLLKCVKCDKPCLDGYEVRNLVSSSFIQRSKGFLAERFIKPPVTIDFDFICKVDIKYVAIMCKVGAQKSTGLELFSQTNSNIGLYESIGSGVLPDMKNGFVFFSHSENVSDIFGDQYYYRTFKSSRNINSVKGIKIKIFRTNSTSVPALGKVEIWGIPLKTVGVSSTGNDKSKVSLFSKETRQPPKDLSHKVINVKDNFKVETLVSTSKTLKHAYSVSNYEDMSVPEDFMDPITCELMSQPLVMPSGKVIDNSTLESHQKAELKWGRGPSDPFTGILFTSSNKPVAASDLKARIDKFLSDNSNHKELQRIPRTVGRNVYSLKAMSCGVSKLISKTLPLSGVEEGIPKTDHITVENINEVPISLSPKRRKLDVPEVKLDNLKKTMERASSINEGGVSSSIEKNRPTSNCFDGKKMVEPISNKSRSFQERMELSLELALKSTLAKLPKLTGDKLTHTGVESLTVICHICKSSNNLFSIPCAHFVCRQCLVKLKNNEPVLCLVCSFSYKSCDVQKIHLFK